MGLDGQERSGNQGEESLAPPWSTKECRWIAGQQC
jgi:hypothetical protein